jgi:NAD(P)-dependent dehydrogenase (short-subunit alcohol dehydrogenase family)
MIYADNGGKNIGLGKTMTTALAANGANKVYIIGRRRHRLEEAVRSINPDVVVPLVGGVADKASLLAAAAHIRREAGYVNLLVASAGVVASPSPSSSPTALATSTNGRLQAGRALNPDAVTAADLESFLLNTPEADFRDPYTINTAGVFYSVAAFVSLLDAGNRKRNVPQRSQVVTVGSSAGQNRNSRAVVGTA